MPDITRRISPEGKTRPALKPETRFKRCAERVWSWASAKTRLGNGLPFNSLLATCYCSTLTALPKRRIGEKRLLEAARANLGPCASKHVNIVVPLVQLELVPRKTTLCLIACRFRCIIEMQSMPQLLKGPGARGLHHSPTQQPQQPIATSAGRDSVRTGVPMAVVRVPGKYSSAVAPNDAPTAVYGYVGQSSAPVAEIR